MYQPSTIFTQLWTSYEKIAFLILQGTGTTCDIESAFENFQTQTKIIKVYKLV